MYRVKLMCTKVPRRQKNIKQKICGVKLMCKWVPRQQKRCGKNVHFRVLNNTKCHVFKRGADVDKKNEG